MATIIKKSIHVSKAANDERKRLSGGPISGMKNRNTNPSIAANKTAKARLMPARKYVGSIGSHPQ